MMEESKVQVKLCHLCRKFIQESKLVNLSSVNQSKLKKWARTNIGRLIEGKAYACQQCIQDAHYLNRKTTKDTKEAWWDEIPLDFNFYYESEESSESEQENEPELPHCRVDLLKLTPEDIASVNGHCQQEDNFPRTCPCCWTECETKEVMVRHVKSVHQNLGSICERCGTFFKNPEVRQIHNELCRKTDDLVKVKCEFCNDWIMSPSQLAINAIMTNGSVRCNTCKV
ncbi:uncharacterized protein LOC132195191 [Neocloeon triangulifer]|uniref:uncharacterized protein LOC132195191 n=1 Tax=Neocloeon triangulifer TaxID=2078957 RepID=UPI00286F3B78|nr:uncharacterized protein LOC132195191 [Neocloeon triangulifer]XP_059472999.1 uncharacterized protein LOC132195191 [Neocloeon triangulifer]